MRIIGHRGAAGLALENTRQSLGVAKKLELDGIEIDIRLTKDRKFVLCHDKDTERISPDNLTIRHHTLADLQQLRLNNDEAILSLDEALKQLAGEWVIIEAKDGGCADELLAVIDAFPRLKVTVASFNHELARELEQKRPDLSVYLAEHTKPTEIIRMIGNARANGMDLNAWLLNPLTYWLAKRRGYDIMVYTINSPFVARFIERFYPDVAIVTDYPNRFAPERRAKYEITKG